MFKFNPIPIHGILVDNAVVGRSVRYAYGADGEVETQEIAGAVVKLARDKLGRLTEKRVLGKDGEVLACLRYFYAPGGALTAREINGVYQELVTDEKGQLTAVKDRDGNVLERYVYDPVGNLLEKTVHGRVTKYEYDAANQLVAQTTDAGTPQEKRVEFAYDGAGRMVREGQREYRYGGLDKVVAVLEAGRTVAEFAYGADGQLANVTRQSGESERPALAGRSFFRRPGAGGVTRRRFLLMACPRTWFHQARLLSGYSCLSGARGR